MTEFQVQADLYKYWGRSRGGKKARLMIDNVFVFDWESDFLILTRNEYFVEFEIKCTRVDYFNDFRKSGRHKCLSAEIECLAPNKFYFVCPDGLIQKSEVPIYAGLMYYFPAEKSYPKRFKEIKPAPFLHRIKMNLFKELCIKYFYKYLNNMKKLIILLLLLSSSCCTTGRLCVSETDKHVKGQRHKYQTYKGQCPSQGKYYKWLFIIPIKKK